VGTGGSVPPARERLPVHGERADRGEPRGGEAGHEQRAGVHGIGGIRPEEGRRIGEFEGAVRDVPPLVRRERGVCDAAEELHGDFE